MCKTWVCYLQGQGHSDFGFIQWNHDYFYYVFWTADLFMTSLVWQCMFISWSILWKGCFAVFKVKVIVKVLNFSECLPGQYLWSIKPNVVMHYYQPEYQLSYRKIVLIISQSIIQKYLFDMFKVKATIVSTRSSEILNDFCNPNDFDGTSSQGRLRHHEKIFLLLHRAWDREHGLGDCGLDCCHSWPCRYLK